MKVWEQRELREIAKKRTEKNRNLLTNNVLSNSAIYGIVKQTEYFDKSIANNIQNYYLVYENDFVYNPRISNNAPFGPISRNKLNELGVMSPLYLVFYFSTKSLSDYLEIYFKSSKWHKFMYMSGNSGARSDRFAIKDNDFFRMKIKMPHSKDEINKIYKFNILLYKLLTLYVKKSTYISSYITYFINVFFNDGNFFEQKNAHNFEKQELKLGDILIKNNAKNKDLSVLNVESISNKKGFVSQKEQFDNYQVASKDLSNYYVIHPKDFAYNPSRINVGSIAYKSPNDVKGIVSPLYVSFKCKNDIILDKYLWYWFKSANFEHQRIRLSEGGVRDTLSFNQLSKMKISIPSFKIQKQTINFLEILIQYKEEIDLKLDNLKSIKNTFLQNMFL